MSWWIEYRNQTTGRSYDSVAVRSLPMADMNMPTNAEREAMCKAWDTQQAEESRWFAACMAGPEARAAYLDVEMAAAA